MAKSNVQEVIDTIIKNWNGLFSKLSKKKEDGLVVTADDVKPAVLEAGEDIYENNLTPAMVAETGYKVDEFNEIYDKVTDTKINASEEVPSVQEEVQVNPIQLAALKEAETPVEIESIVTAVKDNPNFIPEPPATTDQGAPEAHDVSAASVSQGFVEGDNPPQPERGGGDPQPATDLAPADDLGAGLSNVGTTPLPSNDDSGTAPTVPADTGSEPAPAPDPTPTPSPDPAPTPDSTGSDQSPGSVITPNAEQGQSATPASTTYSYTHLKNDGTTEVVSTSNIMELATRMSADINDGAVQFSDQATFDVLKTLGAVPADAVYQGPTSSPDDYNSNNGGQQQGGGQQGPEPSASGSLSYTLTKNDGTTEVKTANSVGELTGMIMGDQSRGNIQLNNEATFTALQGVGLIPAGMTYQDAMNGAGSGQGTPATGGGSPTPDATPTPAPTPAAPATSDFVRNELNKMFMQYTGRPADENDIAIHGPKITSGQYSLDNFRFDIAAAPEAQAFREKTIKEFFRQYVGSEATQADIDANSQIMAAGETIDKTRDRFLAAPPSQAFHNSMIITDSQGVTRDLYGFPPSDRDAAKNHIAGGGTFAQLDNLGSIMNSGDPVAISNWENFVANGGAMPAPPSSGNGGSNPAPATNTPPPVDPIVPAPAPPDFTPSTDSYRPGGATADPARDAAPYRPGDSTPDPARDATPYRPGDSSSDDARDATPYRPGTGTAPSGDASSQNRGPGGNPNYQPPANPYPIPAGSVPLAPTASYNQGPSNESSLPTPPVTSQDGTSFGNRYEAERGN